MTGALLVALWLLLLFDGCMFLAALDDDPAPDPPSIHQSTTPDQVSRITHPASRISPSLHHSITAPLP